MSEALSVALTGLGANKLRTGLTILGLMIGVGSVIVLIAVGTGSSAAVQAQIDALGANTLTISAAPNIGGLFGQSSSSGLTLTDAYALENHFKAPDVKSVAPVVSASDVTLTYGSSTYEPSTFVGTTPGYESARDYSISEGRWFSRAEVKNKANVLVVGPTVAQELFGGGDPVGQNVEIDNSSFEIIGETAPKGSNGSTDLDDLAAAPISTVQQLITGYGSIDQILVQAQSADALSAAQTEVTDILNQLDPPCPRAPTSPATSRLSTRARSCRPPTPATRCSRRCWPRSPRSRCWSAASA